MCRSKRIETLATKIGDNANVIFDSKKHFKHFIINQTYLYKIFVAYEYNRYYRIRCEEYKLEFLCGPVIEMARTIAYWRSNAVAASKVVNEISIHQIKDIGKSARL